MCNGSGSATLPVTREHLPVPRDPGRDPDPGRQTQPDPPAQTISPRFPFPHHRHNPSSRDIQVKYHGFKSGHYHKNIWEKLRPN